MIVLKTPLEMAVDSSFGVEEAAEIIVKEISR